MDNEWLLYKLKYDNPCAIPLSFSIRIFDPLKIQKVPWKYSPRHVQLEIGMSEDNFHYISRVFEVDMDCRDIQTFPLEP